MNQKAIISSNLYYPNSNVFLSLVLVIISTLISQAQYWNFNRIDNEQGLSNSAVTEIYQDSKKYMWFGTWDGLNKFDGKEIKSFLPERTNNSSIGNNIIRKILESNDSTLWIVTDKNINKYDKNSESFSVYFNSDDTYLGKERIIQSSLSKDSVLWCSIYDKGVVYFSSEEQSFQSIDVENRYQEYIKRIVGIKAFTQNRIAILTEEGNLITLIKEEKWIPIRTDSLKISANIIPENKWFIDHNNSSYLFTEIEGGGIISVDLETGEKKLIGTEEEGLLITEVSQSRNKDFLWVGTDDGKVYKLYLKDEVELENVSSSFPEIYNEKVKILKIFETESILWIGTDGSGVFEYNTLRKPFVSIGKGEPGSGKLNHNIIRAIAEDNKGNIIVGTRGGGVNIIDKQHTSTRLITGTNGLSNNAVLAITPDNNGNFWIGVDGEGVDFYDSESAKVLHFPEDFINPRDLYFRSVYSICIDSYGDIWLGTSGYGMIKLSVKKVGPARYQLVNFSQFTNSTDSEISLKSNIVYSIIEDRPNYLWVGSRGGGLQQLNTISNEFTSIHGEIDNDVISLYKSKHKDELWVGTSNGLFQLTTTNYSYQHYSKYNGLQSNTIHAIEQDSSGNIWVSTNKGISFWKRSTGLFRTYNIKDGLLGNEFSDGASFKSRISDRIYFGGVKGLTIIDTDKINISNEFPPLVFQELTVFSKKIKPNNGDKILKKHIDDTDTLILRSSENFFSISYAALNYINNDNSKYSYFLDGFDQGWSAPGEQRTARFTNVPTGTFTLKVKCSNQDGIWNPEFRSLTIIVTPPIWLTIQAYIAYAFIFFVIIAISYSVIKKRGLIKRQLYVAQFEKKHQEEINNYKLRFFTNISHEFRTPLSLIILPANKLIDKIDQYPELRNKIESIHNNATRLLKLIGELIEFRKIESDQLKLNVSEADLSDYLKKITEAFMQFAEARKINLHFETDNPEPCMAWFDQDHLKTIMLNLISNAIKFNRPDGFVVVSLSVEGNRATINVEDTGVGISEQYTSKIFQRFYNITNDSMQDLDYSESSGIGLTLTKSLVEAHRGNISVMSKVGEGSKFKIEFPIDKESYPDDVVDNPVRFDSIITEQKIHAEFVNYTGSVTSSFTEQEENQDDDKDTILLVDDNAEFREIIKEILTNSYNLIEASNGNEALQLIEERSVDIIISDIIMPELNGYELCKKIKGNINTSDIPFILLTAMGEIENRIKGIDIGADSYIPKPFHPEHLITRVEKLLESRKKIRQIIMHEPWRVKEVKTGLVQQDSLWLHKLNSFLTENMVNPELDSTMLQKEFGISKTQLYRKIKSITGHTPHGLIKKFRLNRASQLLLEGDKNISEVSYLTGFNNRSYFYRCFREEFGCSPSDYKNHKTVNG